MLELASELGVAPALWGAVHDRRDRIPTSVSENLHQSHLANAVRNSRFRRALTDAVREMNDAGIVPMLFKGALALVDGTAGVIGGRWMADLDIAVAANDVEEAARALERLGYGAEPGQPFLHPHELPFVNARMPGAIELHTELGSAPIPSVLPVTEVWAHSIGVEVGDWQARAPSPTHQVVHNVLHAAVQDLNHAVGGLPLRQLIVLDRLVQRYGDEVDWEDVRRRMQRHGLSRELLDHLWLAHRFVGMRLPLDAGDNRASRRQARTHEAKVTIGFALGWPPHVQRNLRFAFGREYLDSLYGHRNRPLSLTGARVRHAVTIIRRDGRRLLGDVLMRRE